MSTTNLPFTPAQALTCLDVVRRYPGRADANAVITAQVQGLVLPAADAFGTAEAEADRAEAAVTEARSVTDTQDEALDVAFLKLVRTLVDEKGHARPDRVRSVVGLPPSKVTGLGRSTKVALLRSLREQAAIRSDLSGTTAEMKDLSTALDVFETDLHDLQTLDKALHAAITARDAAEAAFNVQWRAFVGLVTSIHGAGNGILPTFVRPSAKKAEPAPEPAALAAK